MSDEIKVYANKYGRTNYVLRWTDPLTGRRMTQSAKTSNKTEAKKAAGVLEKELREGRYAPPSKMLWADFTFAYCDKVARALKPRTRNHIDTVLKTVSRILGPKRVADITAPRLTAMEAELRKEGKAEATIRSYFAHMHAIMQWAVDQGNIPRLPKFPDRKKHKTRDKDMKGRPITRDEFNRMLAAVPEAIFGRPTEAKGEDQAAKPPKPLTAEQEQTRQKIIARWRRYLRGLWWSGLRLGESLDLYWDRSDMIMVDLSGRWPALKIPGRLQKSGKDEVYPVAPEFGKMLLAVPKGRRHGRVFKLTGQRGGEPRFWWVSETVSRIGEAAGVVVDEKTKTDPETGEPVKALKYASAHDLRRSFGERWSSRLMPADLMKLMRHESIETTMRFYVGKNAMRTADRAWAAYESEQEARKGRKGNKKAIGHKTGHKTPVEQEAVAQEATEALVFQGLRK